MDDAPLILETFKEDPGLAAVVEKLGLQEEARETFLKWLHDPGDRYIDAAVPRVVAGLCRPSDLGGKSPLYKRRGLPLFRHCATGYRVTFRSVLSAPSAGPRTMLRVPSVSSTMETISSMPAIPEARAAAHTSSRVTRSFFIASSRNCA